MSIRRLQVPPAVEGAEAAEQFTAVAAARWYDPPNRKEVPSYGSRDGTNANALSFGAP